MTTQVRYGPEDREIDLASLTAADYQLITELHCNIRSGDRTLICLQPTAGNGELHIVQKNGRYFAAHFAGGAHGQHVVALESDEHKRQKDYWQRAAEDAGFKAAKEVRSGNGTVLDVAINGPVRTGIEIQHSSITLPKVKSRTTRSFRAGYTTVWFSDRGTRPPWFYRVPSLGCNEDAGWPEELPPRRAVTATGLSQIEAVRCVVGAFQQCPDGFYRPCGRPHAKPVPWTGLTVDDVAALIPAGEAVPVVGPKGYVHLMPPASRTLYHELSGRSGIYEPGGKPKLKRTASRSKECSSPVHGDVIQMVIAGRAHAATICRSCQQPVPVSVAYDGCHVMCEPVT